MNGQIGFDDAPGGGTVFYVDLPSADQRARWDSEFAAGNPAPLVPRDEDRPAVARSNRKA
jgi:hypothetical protein